MANKTYVFELEMLKLVDKIEIEIVAESEIARDAFLKKFLETEKEDKYFVDPKNPTKRYQKQYIYACNLKGAR